MGGGDGGIRQWRLADGHEVGRQTGMGVNAVCVSRDQKWIVCGTTKGASVWDGEMTERVIDVEDETEVWGVDVSPDSTRLATGTYKYASIWSLASGERLVGPLEHDDYVTGLRFSPSGEHIATAYWSGQATCIFDSNTGDKLVTIKVDSPSWLGTPLAWSTDAQRIYAACHDNKIKSLDIATRSLFAESQILLDGGGTIPSIALAPNGKFIVTFARHSILLLDTSTLTRIDRVIEDSEEIRSVSISPDNRYLATGRHDGKIVIHDLSKILPDLYGPFHVSIRELVVLGCQKSPILSLLLTIYVGTHSRENPFDIG